VDEKSILASAADRIAEHRTAPVELTLKAPDGRPARDAAVRIKLTNHEFKFGCNAFLLCRINDAELQHAYEERFADLLNFATLPFYWGSYEYQPGKTKEALLDAMAQWCRDKGVTAKGHPLVWHEVFPGWAKRLPDDEVVRRQEQRVREIVPHFKGFVDIWDVVNEANASHRHDNAIGRWIGKDDPAKRVATALRWAREAGPETTLIYNDFDVSKANERLVEALIQRQAPLDVIGIQSHMHKGTWPIEKVWDVCERFGRFGRPIHFTETTVLSGPLKAKDDNDWHKRRTDWRTTPEGEAAQVEYGEKLYTTLFSHPAVEAVTWWDFSDHGAWQGAPAGLVSDRMTPKPLYNRLIELVRKVWCTDVKGSTNTDGRVTATCFFGEHEVRAQLPSGEALRGTFLASRRGARSLDVALG